MAKKRSVSHISRKTREKKIKPFFPEEDLSSWKEHWWDMPEFNMGDATPCHHIVVNFFTKEDFLAFKKALGISISSKCNSIWYPKKQRIDEPKEWCYVED
jgi:hypothetical protein